ncbi:MAG: metallo-beta-lactamase superfamily protein [Paucimonas sp.]|nr:metallo-beta-lactamase superfamily protein [Paucimonas sp.]
MDRTKGEITVRSKGNVIRIPILPFGLVNAHLVSGSRGCILVDTGLPGSERRINWVLKSIGMNFKDIRLIIVTHAHVDHAGSAARIRSLSGAPIVAHADDAPYYARKAAMSFCPTGWFGRLFIKTNLMFEPYEPFTPDILIKEGASVDLAPYGVKGEIRHTPGHTAGSLSVLLESREALVGDLISSGILLGGLARTNVAKRPPFEDDPLAVSDALHRMVAAGAEAFYMGHGGPLHAAEVCRHAQLLAGITEVPYTASLSAATKLSLRQRSRNLE